MIDSFLDSFFMQLTHPEFWSGIVVGGCGVLIFLIKAGIVDVSKHKLHRPGWKD